MGTWVERIPEEISDALYRLGRHIEHDVKSLQYAFDDAQVAGINSVDHVRQIPVLDQGNLGSCTGNAATGACGTDPLWGPLLAALQGLQLNEDEAVKLYGLATHLDSVPGSYPPDDTGSTGLAVAKACVQQHMIVGYQHTFSMQAALKALQVTPVIIGVNWYDSFDSPDADGTVAISAGAQVRGGHEFVLDGVDAENQFVHATNSWGTSWANNGRFRISWADFDRLLHEQGDVTVLVPLAQPTPTPTPPKPTPTPTPTPPKPTPTPTPTPDDVDRAFWTQAQNWAKAKGL